MARRLRILAALVAGAATVRLLSGDFFVVQIVVKSLWLGIIAMSLVFLSGYGGMTSLAQMALAGVSGNAIANLTALHHWPAGAALIVALMITLAVAAVAGLVAARSFGIYYLMLTLAIAVFLYYFALQYRPLTLGFGGINGVHAPDVGPLHLTDVTTFYILALGCAIGVLALTEALLRSRFGMAVQGVRDNPRRMAALGFNVTAVRVGAFVFAAAIAFVGGTLAVWYNGRISPGSMDVTRTLQILVIAVLGGMSSLRGAWLGAFAVTLLANYASDLTPRYNTVIGVVFVAVLLLAPGGLSDLVQLRRRLSRPTLGRRRPAQAA